MALPLKSLDQITETDLLALITAAESENKVIDYKETLPGNADSDRKEFLYDVSSFANASGGHLLYGIKAKDGIPTELKGTANLNADAEKLRLHNILQSGIQPRIPGVEIHEVKLKGDNSVLLVRIPRSWSSPHMVTFQSASKFYSRNSAGKYPLDVSEIRAAFLMSETVGQKIRSFRTERLATIIADELPVKLEKPQRLVFHILPLISFSSGFSVNVAATKTISDGYVNRFIPYGSMMHVIGQGSSQFTFDGILFRLGQAKDPCNSYTQFFRNGCVEVVDCYFSQNHGGQKTIWSENYEGILIDYSEVLFGVLKKLSIEPPFFVGLSLLGVRGYTVLLDRMRHGLAMTMNSRPIDRDNLIIPEIMIEDFEIDRSVAFRPLFDPVWNACGHVGSTRYA
jgi:hypothetical protein